jgi:membrane fusion protein, multidrug efflux system
VVDRHKKIREGSHVDVYLMGHPDRTFNGVVESIGFGVFRKMER